VRRRTEQPDEAGRVEEHTQAKGCSHEHEVVHLREEEVERICCRKVRWAGWMKWRMGSERAP